MKARVRMSRPKGNREWKVTMRMNGMEMVTIYSALHDCMNNQNVSKSNRNLAWRMMKVIGEAWYEAKRRQNHTMHRD